LALASLVELDLSWTRVDDDCVNSWSAELPHLRTLRLSGNKNVTDVGIQALYQKRYPSLRFLYLQNTRVTSASFNTLAEMQLEELGLSFSDAKEAKTAQKYFSTTILISSANQEKNKQTNKLEFVG
jgi:hypothetical protein